VTYHFNDIMCLSIKEKSDTLKIKLCMGNIQVLSTEAANKRMIYIYPTFCRSIIYVDYSLFVYYYKLFEEISTSLD
jgi:hypothetical protein